MIDLKRVDSVLTQLASEKKLPKEKLVEAVEAAIKTAYKKDFGSKDSVVNVKLDFAKNTVEVSVMKTVVEAVEDAHLQIALSEVEDSGFAVGDTVELDVTDEVLNADGFGRIAAGAARQVIQQKIQDTEKEKIYDLFKDKEGQLVSLRVELVENSRVVLDYNGHHVILPKSEQVARDGYFPGQRLSLYVSRVEEDTIHGPRITLSRRDKGLITELFKANVPELEEGTINIVAIARIAGVKTKVLVATDYEEVDPAGCLIGPKGVRVKAVVDELMGEKVDIVPLTRDLQEVMTKALVPGKIEKFQIDEENALVRVWVAEDEKAKVLGKGGVNVNLASELLGYKIIVEMSESAPQEEQAEAV